MSCFFKYNVDTGVASYGVRAHARHCRILFWSHFRAAQTLIRLHVVPYPGKQYTGLQLYQDEFRNIFVYH